VTGEQLAAVDVMVRSRIVKTNGELVTVNYMIQRSGYSRLISDIYLDGAIQRGAYDIGISEITVKVHRGQVMRKMKAASLPDLARMTDKLNLTAEKSQSCYIRPQHRSACAPPILRLRD
jgi:hypothetical protein